MIQPSRTLLNASLKVLAWLTLAGIVAATLGPVRLRPQIWLGHADVDRLVAYFGLSFIFVWAYPQQRLRVACLILLGAAALEMFQLLTPDRHGHLVDLAIKLLGAAVGLQTGLWSRRLLA